MQICLIRSFHLTNMPCITKESILFIIIIIIDFVNIFLFKTTENVDQKRKITLFFLFSSETNLSRDKHPQS